MTVHIRRGNIMIGATWDELQNIHFCKLSKVQNIHFSPETVLGQAQSTRASFSSVVININSSKDSSTINTSSLSSPLDRFPTLDYINNPRSFLSVSFLLPGQSGAKWYTHGQLQLVVWLHLHLKHFFGTKFLPTFSNGFFLPL